MESKSFLKSKTFWAGIIGIVIGILQYTQGNLLAGSEISLAGLLAIILRLFTEQPISFK